MANWGKVERILGIDFGSKRVGMALSDMLGITAQPLFTLERKNKETDFAVIEKIITEKKVSKVVLGLPLNMDGSEGELCRLSRAYGKQINERFSISVEFFDERLSSIQVERMLIDEADISRAKRTGAKDKLAACIILQAYMDAHKISG